MIRRKIEHKEKQYGGADCLSLLKNAEAGRQCVRLDAWPAVLVLWVAALIPKPENGVRIWCKSIHQNPTGLPVGAVSYSILSRLVPLVEHRTDSKRRKKDKGVFHKIAVTPLSFSFDSSNCYIFQVFPYMSR